MSDSSESDLPNLHGKWKLKKQENLDAYLAESGIGWVLRKMACATKPEMNIEQKGKHFHIEIHTTMVKKTWDFNLGESFEEVAEMTKDIMVVSTKAENGKLVLDFTPKVEGKGKPQNHTRYLENGHLILTLTMGEVTAKRIFEKI